MIWGWVVAAFLIMFIGLAMVSCMNAAPVFDSPQGDLASSMPTSGGLYFWTHRLAPPEYRNFLAWLVGCMYSLPIQTTHSHQTRPSSATSRPSRPSHGPVPPYSSPPCRSTTPSLARPQRRLSACTSPSLLSAACTARTFRPCLPDSRPQVSC